MEDSSQTSVNYSGIRIDAKSRREWGIRKGGKKGLRESTVTRKLARARVRRRRAKALYKGEVGRI